MEIHQNVGVFRVEDARQILDLIAACFCEVERLRPSGQRVERRQSTTTSRRQKDFQIVDAGIS